MMRGGALMGRKYYLHRISHEGYISYSLLEKGYLTLGWSKFTDSDILNAAREDEYRRFNPIAKEYGEDKNRSRWCMWYFARMMKEDYVVVPQYDGRFSIYEVCEEAKPIYYIEDIIPDVYPAWGDHKIVWKEHRLYDETESRLIDLGFSIKVKPIVEGVLRNYVTGVLVSRMKIRSTNADISDIGSHVEIAKKVGETGTPVSLYEQSIETLSIQLKEKLKDILDDSRFEKLIKWYIEKCGAEYTKIPAKNEPGKRDGADADIVAEFKNLKHIVYIQAKLHSGETSDWAVNQINEYFSQKSEGDPDYSYARWVISTCDSFSEKAVMLAKQNNVRLIDGEEFARMLLDAGLLSLDDAFYE